MSYKWPIRLRPFKNVSLEGANFAIFSTDLRALLLCLLHCNLTQVGFETCWFWSAKKICLVIQPLSRWPAFRMTQGANYRRWDSIWVGFLCLVLQSEFDKGERQRSTQTGAASHRKVLWFDNVCMTHELILDACLRWKLLWNLGALRSWFIIRNLVLYLVTHFMWWTHKGFWVYPTSLSLT